MDGFLSRVIGIVLIFLGLVVSPLINVLGNQEMEDRIAVLNATSEFLDKQADKRSITDDDLNEFYLNVSSHGMVLDVKVQRLVKTAVKAPDGTINTTYIAADNMNALNNGDIIQVHIEEVSTTLYRKMLHAFLRIDEKKYKLDRAKYVR